MYLYSRVDTKSIACIMLIVTVRAGSDALQQSPVPPGGRRKFNSTRSDNMAAKKGRKKAAKKGGRKAAKKSTRKAAKKSGRKTAKRAKKASAPAPAAM